MMGQFDGVIKYDGIRRVCLNHRIIKKANLTGKAKFVGQVKNNCIILIPAEHFFNEVRKDSSILERADQWLWDNLAKDDYKLRKLLFGK